jgi:hypothetical protein
MHLVAGERNPRPEEAGRMSRVRVARFNPASYGRIKILFYALCR